MGVIIPIPPIIGHQFILSFFSRLMEHGSLSHAYCFIGQDHVGKRAVVETIAAEHFGVSRDRLSIIPDFFVVEREQDEEKQKMKKDIMIEQIHWLIAFLSESAICGKKKIVLIDEAEKMNTSAVNALLKSVEEPRGDTTIFLVTNNENKLPKTILSRCQSFFFHAVKEEELEHALVRRGVPEKEAKQFSRLAHGLPGLALRWLEDREVFLAHEHGREQFFSLLHGPLYDILSEGEDILANKEDILALWQVLIRDIFFSSLGKFEFTMHAIPKEFYFSGSQFLELSDRIRETRELLSKHIHPRLLLERLFLLFPRKE